MAPTARRLPTPRIGRMGHNPANFACHIGTGPWVRGNTVRIPVETTGQATSRRIWRRFNGQPEQLIHEIPDNVTTKYQDDVL